MRALFLSFLVLGIAGVLAALAVILFYVTGSTAKGVEVSWSFFICLLIGLFGFRWALILTPEEVSRPE